MSRTLAVDYGTVRVGLAVSDPLGIMASPIGVVPRKEAVRHIGDLTEQMDIGTIVVGLPAALGGHEGVSAVEARALGEEIHQTTGIPVVYHDERFTSRMAESNLLEKGMKRRDRRNKVDEVAAAIILQDYLDSHRTA